MTLAFTSFTRTLLAAGLLTLGLAHQAQAQTTRSLADDPSTIDQFDSRYDDLSQPWTEIIKLMPPAPSHPVDMSKLIVYYTEASGLRYAIDPDSIVTAPGSTVRYTLVSRSEQGATSVTYEAMSCEAKNRRIYAFGRSGGANQPGTWSQPARSDWDRVGLSEGKTAHAVLYSEVFCDTKFLLGTKAQIVDRLKKPRKVSTIN